MNTTISTRAGGVPSAARARRQGLFAIVAKVIAAAAAIAGSVCVPQPAAAQFTQQGAKLVGAGAVGSEVDQANSVAVSADGRPMLRSQPDILGAIWVDKELVLIDQHLNPKINPSMLGRYRFSVAHEIGHWRLHRSFVARDANQTLLFGTSTEPTVICRASEGHEPIEWQANFFAACLLMPRRRVHDEWKERLGRTRPLLLSDLRPNDKVMMRAQSMIYEQGRNEAGAVGDESRPRKSGQDDRWSFCLTAGTLCPSNQEIR